MKPVVVINRILVKEGAMDEFIAAQQRFGSTLGRCGLVGGRMYRGADGRSATLVSMFESKEAVDALFQLAQFKEHLQTMQPIVESSSPVLYEEAYTTGDFH